ncbi:MAG: hypothetical protein ACM3O6_11365 [Acidobacteriota bacterium]
MVVNPTLNYMKGQAAHFNNDAGLLGLISEYERWCGHDPTGRIRQGVKERFEARLTALKGYNMTPRILGTYADALESATIDTATRPRREPLPTPHPLAGTPLGPMEGAFRAAAQERQEEIARLGGGALGEERYQLLYGGRS